MPANNRNGWWIVASWLTLLFAVPAMAADFHSAWAPGTQRNWVGPQYWSNPLQDWQVANDRLECLSRGSNRNVHVLTRQLEGASGDLRMSVRLGLVGGKKPARDNAWVGFRIAAQGELSDYRDNVFKGEGIDAGVTTSGKLFIGAPAEGQAAEPLNTDEIELRVTAVPDGKRYKIALSAHDVKRGDQLAQVTKEGVAAERLVGNLALVSYLSDAQGGGRRPGGDATQDRGDQGPHCQCWFADWKISGSKVAAHDDQAFGPILFAQHTLSKNVLKLTAQMAPIGEGDAQTVGLEFRDNNDGAWKTYSRSEIHPLARTATFRIQPWKGAHDVPYRLAYQLADASGKQIDHHWSGTIRRDPVDKESIVVAGFTGNTDAGFPNNAVVRNVRYHDPDVMVFTGDQLYENVGGYGIQREPLEAATLDYLRKWYMLGWAFGDLMRDRPSICMPDDHDVYQGNIWGAAGRPVSLREHESGGYVMNPVWVNMVQRTQSSHLPDPYDPTPIEQDITVYYCEMNYGRISFAILEDRKFKSGPKGLCPPTGGRPDHVTDPNFDPRTADVPGATLLGERQLKFIRDWAADWRSADFKVSLTQTIFANLANYHGAEKMYLVADYDSNGWPQTGRNKALHELRRGFTLMIGGDQHLPSIVHHGIDDFEDAGYSLCVPSIAAGYPRSWLPLEPGKNRKPGMPDYTGQFLDGLGNHITVWAVGNPQEQLRTAPLERLHDKASGYALARLNKQSRKITMEVWRLLADPSDTTTSGQFPGWPMTIDQQDNYGRRAVAYLPTIEVAGLNDPVVQVIDEADNQIVYTLRIKGTDFRPKVFGKGKFTLRVGEPDTGQFKVLRGIESLPPDKQETLEVAF